jgi:4'-phosphopantetheinyl transferase
MRPDVDYGLLAQHHFSSYENEALQLLPPTERDEAFFRCWTRKEAYIKARGKGLSITLSMFDVSLKPGEPALLLQNKEEPHEAERWRLEDLGRDLSRPYSGALAVEGHDWQLSCWQWQGSRA